MTPDHFKPDFHSLVAIARGIDHEMQQLAQSPGYHNGIVTTDSHMIVTLHDLVLRTAETFQAILDHVNEHEARDPDFKTVDARSAFEMARLKDAAPSIIARSLRTTAELARKCPQHLRPNVV